MDRGLWARALAYDLMRGWESGEASWPTRHVIPATAQAGPAARPSSMVFAILHHGAGARIRHAAAQYGPALVNEKLRNEGGHRRKAACYFRRRSFTLAALNSVLGRVLGRRTSTRLLSSRHHALLTPAPGREAAQILDSNGPPVGKTRDQLQVAAHRLDVGAQRREQEVRAHLDLGHAVLSHLETPRDCRLRLAHGLAQLLKRHFFMDKDAPTPLDPVSFLSRECCQDFVQCLRHCHLRHRPFVAFSVLSLAK